MKNENLFITEISEDDFRKLDLVAYTHTREVKDEGNNSGCTYMVWKETKLNDVLDENIAYWIEQGREKDYEDLKQPVTVAIHVENGPNPKDYYFDKFMNRYSGFKTYEFAMGLRHIYSTRDYFEAKKDYWRVPKRETKAIYRIHLNPEHLKRFKLKHKTEIAWIFEDSTNDQTHTIQKHYDLDEKTGEWKLSHVDEVKINKFSASYTPIKEEDIQKLIDSQPEMVRN